MYTLHLPGGQCPTAHGGEEIKGAIIDALQGPCDVKQLSWSHQLSLNGSIVLSVAGELVNKSGDVRIRRFAQTFVLACENSNNRNAFYIHNDICCFFDAAQVPIPMAAPQPPASQPSKTLAPKTPVKDSEPSPVTASPTFGKAAAPDKDEEPVDLKLPQQAEKQEPAPAPVEPAPKSKPSGAAGEKASSKSAAPTAQKPSSWAGITSLNCPVTVEPEKPAPRKPGPPGSGAPKQENSSEVAAKDEDAPAKEDPNASVFVSGVPNGCEKENLQAVMAQFGEVRKIVIKAEKHYAIIDFTDVEAAQRALDAPAPKHDGSILKIEKRRELGDSKGKGGRKPDSKAQGGRGRGQGKAAAQENGYTTVGKDSGKGGRGRRSEKKPQAE